MSETRYYINTVSKDHVLLGISGGFTQACHGKAYPLSRLKRGDWMAFYSPKVHFGKSEICQKFTAYGQIIDDKPFQVKMTESFCPFRRKIRFLDSHEISIRPIIDQLSFIKDKKRWSYMFHFGLFQIPKQDFDLIANLMSPKSKESI
jgi:hypothetical protein